MIYTHTPVFIITAEGEYRHESLPLSVLRRDLTASLLSRLCTFLETILTMVWYPSCVATLSRYTKVRDRSSTRRDSPVHINILLLKSRC